MREAASHLHVPHFGDKRSETKGALPFFLFAEALGSQPRMGNIA
jgi:hypothetical protein